MRIIGKTDGGFILSATATEMANLMGMYSSYDDEYKTLGLQEGRDINAEGLYRKYKNAEHLRNNADTLSKIADTLKKLSEDVEPFIPKEEVRP